MFGMEKLEWWGYLMMNKFLICSAVLTEYLRVTDGQTSCLYITFICCIFDKENI